MLYNICYKYKGDNMNVMLVNGSDGSSNWIHHEESLNLLAKDLISRGYWVDNFVIRDMKMHYCQGCWDCWTKTPGICSLKDDGEEYLKALRNADYVLYCSPVKAGFITSNTKKALDRFIPNVLSHISIYDGECHHLERYPDKPKVLGAVLLDDGKITESSADLIFRNFDRIQKNMRSKKSIRFRLNRENREELLNEIISY